MISNTKAIGIFLGGAGLGSLVTFTLVKEKYDKIIDEEISAMRIFYEGRKEAEKKDDEEDDISKNDLREATSIEEGIAKDIKDYKNYTKIYAEDPEEVVIRPEPDLPNHDDYFDEEDELNESREQPREEFPHDKTKPYVITADEFLNTMTHIDKVELVYFRGDGGVVVDDQDDIVNDVEYVIGEDNLMQFGNDPDDPDMLYIRNPKIGADYEIARNNSSYREMILGDPPKYIPEDELY